MSDHPPYTRRTAELFNVVLRILRDAGGQLPLRDILARIPEVVRLDARDLTVHKSGGVRWSVALQFYAINYEKAGYITRDQGVWSITPEGQRAISLPPDQVFSAARKAYGEWKQAIGQALPEEQAAGEAEASPVSVGAEALATQARSGIAEAVLALNPYEFQSFVATVLKALGYHIARLSPPGPDGGTDILAFPDPLGAQRPHVRVQVKHRKGQKAGREDIAALRGVLIPDREIGLFASSGGISAEGLREANRGSPHIRCYDLDQLIDAYIENYERLAPADRERVPLRRIFIHAPDEV